MAKLPTITAARFREIRTDLAVSQEEMGAVMGTTRRTYWQWENEVREASGSVARLAHLLQKLNEIGIQIKISNDDPNELYIIDRR
jgi:transcriptional regulator with XRE-family HTH domain